MPNPRKEPASRSALREAREEYFRISVEMDESNLAVLSRTHGMVQPDGNHALEQLAKRKRLAFEKYQAELVELRSHIQAVHAPEHPVARNIPGRDKVMAQPAAGPQLTARELDVLERIALGMTSKEIARELNITFKTAVTHRTHLMSKFDASNVALLIRRAIASGHIKP